MQVAWKLLLQACAPSSHVCCQHLHSYNTKYHQEHNNSSPNFVNMPHSGNSLRLAMIEEITTVLSSKWAFS